MRRTGVLLHVFLALAASGLVARQGAPVAVAEPTRVVEAYRGFNAGRSWYDVANARTLIGLSRDRRRLTVMVVERSPVSEGLAVGEAARWMARDYGVWDALNLDGGGSSTMVWQHPESREYALLNTSSDNPNGRRVATSLAFFARPRPHQ